MYRVLDMAVYVFCNALNKMGNYFVCYVDVDLSGDRGM